MSACTGRHWRKTTLGDFAPFLYGKGLAKPDRDKSGAIPVYGSNGIVGHHSASLATGPVVVIGRKGNAGAVHYSKESCWPIDTAFYIPDDSSRDARFVCYLLQTLRLSNLDSDSAVPGLNRNAAHSRSIWVPPLAEQRRIAAVLGALDDKIELNRRMNETLEETARAIFKNWFVDFAPTRAKAAGRTPPGLSPPTSHPFPARLDADGKPRGWEIRNVLSMCSTITAGGTPDRGKNQFWKNGNVPWFKTGELTDSFLLNSSEMITEDGIKKSNAKVLPPDAVLMAMYAAPTVGRLGVLSLPSSFNQACIGMVAKPAIGAEFLYLTLRHGRSWFISRASGAAQQNLSKTIVENYESIVPSADVLSVFNLMIRPLYQKILFAAKESKALSELRDSLLPQLISGKIRL